MCVLYILSKYKPNICLSYYKNLLRDYFTIGFHFCWPFSPSFLLPLSHSFFLPINIFYLPPSSSNQSAYVHFRVLFFLVSIHFIWRFQCLVQPSQCVCGAHFTFFFCLGKMCFDTALSLSCFLAFSLLWTYHDYLNRAISYKTNECWYLTIFIY